MSSNAFNELDSEYMHAENLREQARSERQQAKGKTATIKGFIHFRDRSNWEDSKYAFFMSDDMSECGYVKVMAYELTIEIPDAFNPTAAQLDALEKQRAALSKEFNLRIAQINDQISKLQCLEFTPAEAA
jgi:beta-mannanase